jgi:hypothetical protein
MYLFAIFFVINQNNHLTFYLFLLYLLNFGFCFVFLILPFKMNSSRRTKPLVGDAMEFIKDVKLVFQDKREKFDEFMKLLHDYSAKRINKRVVKEGVMELLKEHQDLISRFNIFLPPGHEISFPLEDDQQRCDGSVHPQRWTSTHR